MPALQGKLSASQESGRPLAAARKSPSPVAEVGETLIVECQISAEAVKSHAFEQLLATQQIDLVAAEGPGEAARFAARDEHQEVTAAAPSEEAFLVEAAPEQIAATLVELQSRGVEFPSVTIQSPAKEKAAEEPAAKPLAQAGAQQTAARRGRAVRVESDALTLKKAEEAKAGGRGEPASTSGKRETPLRQSASEATAPATQRVLFLLRVVPQAEPSR